MSRLFKYFLVDIAIITLLTNCGEQKVTKKEQPIPAKCNTEFRIGTDKPPIDCEYEIKTFIPSVTTLNCAKGNCGEDLWTRLLRHQGYGSPTHNYIKDDDIKEYYYVRVESFDKTITNLPSFVETYAEFLSMKDNPKKTTITWEPPEKPGSYTLYIDHNIFEFSYVKGLDVGYNYSGAVGYTTATSTAFKADSQRPWVPLNSTGYTAYNEGYYRGLDIEYSSGYMYGVRGTGLLLV